MDPQEKIRLLQIELAKAKAEASQLRKRFGVNEKHTRRVQQAQEDALLLATIKLAGIHPSRRLAASVGISQNRWQNAWALLRMARIITRQRHWGTSDLILIESRLKVATERALKDKDAFFLRHVRHHRW